MANPTWPLALPQSLPLEAELTPRENRIVSEMGVGPPKMRPVPGSEATPDDLTFSMVLWNDQASALREFWRSSGSLVFDWKDPVTDETRSFRFAERPKLKVIAGGESNSAKWVASVHLEVQRS